MRWDDFLGDGSDAADAADLPIVPETAPGKPHVGEVKAAKLADKPFDWAKSDRNRNGTCLVIEVAVPKHRPFEVTIPCHYAGKIQALCKSARVHPPVRGGDWDEQCIVGQVVTFESVTAVSPMGTEYVRVTRWCPNAEPPAAIKSKPASRTQAAKAHHASSPDDDIPF